MQTQTVTEAPRLGKLYLQAVVTARLGGGGALPDTELVLPDQVVDPGHLAAYVRVCGGSLRDRLPATYPHLLAFPLQVRLLADRKFPLPLPGLVHLRNVCTQHRPIATDDPLTLRVHAERLVAHPKGAQVDLVATAEVSGERVWSGRSTYLARGSDAHGAHGATAPATVDGVAVGPAVELADDPAAAVWRIPADAGRRYAAVSGDVNPIHLNALAARVFGFPRAIAHGMWCKARALAAVEARLPDAFAVDVAFRKPVLLPSTVHHVVRRAADGWDFALLRPNGEGAHLVGTVRPPADEVLPAPR
jgi:acyl dehydratase